MIAPETRMGPVHLTVSDLARSLDFYRSALGLEVQDEDDGRAAFGAGKTELLVLHEQPGAPPADGHTGLFHFALLLPDRASLARFLAHAARERVPLQGLSDHDVSEAIYLGDPDHHGIEIYADRPRERWEGKVAELMTTLPLDTNDLLRLATDEPFEGLAEGTTMGHVHLSVGDVEETVAFYGDLGFDVMARYGGEAAFLATGGYHHHLGANTWQSRGAPYAPGDRARLTLVEIHDAPEGRELRDPSGIPIVLSTKGPP